MMRLLIDSQECPFDAEKRLRLRWSAAALKSVDAARTGVAVTLDIPSTPLTDRIFGSPRDLHTATAFNDTEHRGVIECDGAEVHAGTAVLVGTSEKEGAAFYRVTITGGAARWAKHAARTMFNALPMKFSMRLTPLQIEQSWRQEDAAVRFLPVLRDTYEPTYSSVGLMPAEKIMSTDDYHPFISVREILRTIFAESGYELRGGFVDSDFFRSLYISGAYQSTDTESVRRRMDFMAGRTDDAQSTADATGRVYFSPYMSVNTIGNYVDRFFSDDGTFYSCGSCMATENGRTVFRPLTTVKVGFEYSVRYVTDYRIASRTRLTGFDTLYTPSTGEVHYELANRFADRRGQLTPSFDYRAVVFNHTAGTRYRIVCTAATGATYVMGEFSARSAIVSTGTASGYSNPVLQTASSSGAWVAYSGDWALYDGYITETGQTEVAFTLRSPSQSCSPTSPATFDRMYISGAERGMTFRLLASSTLRPVFSANAGYGSQLSFADIAHLPVRQGVFIEAVRQMFNMVILTDEESKTVTMQPSDEFYAGLADPDASAADWSGRIDLSFGTDSCDLSLTARDNLILGYRDEDGAVRRYNTENDTVFGQWEAATGRYGSVEGDDEVRNPLFSPTLNIAGRYVNAPSALLMQVCDRDDASAYSLSEISPRIVRWLGMQPLPDGERWGYPSSGGDYPLAAFHLAPCTAAPQGSTLCYEDRDGITGLHRHYDTQVRRLRTSRAVTVRLHMTPDEWAALHRPEGQWPSVASVFRLTLNGDSGLYTLDEADRYDPRDGMAECRFIQVDTAAHNH